jgi:hypothetical protein
MRRQFISMAMLEALVLLGSFTADAKKKPEEPVRESFVANFLSASGNAPYLTIAIQEFSTDDEVQQLVQSYARGGEDSLRSAMGKSKKGYFTLGSSQEVRLRMIQAQPVGTGRRLLLVGEAPDTFFPGESPGASSSAGTGPRMVLVGHRGYDYSVIQLEVDEKGNGKGLIYPYCNVVFNEQGKLVVKPIQGVLVPSSYSQPNQLVNVHWQK